MSSAVYRRRRAAVLGALLIVATVAVVATVLASRTSAESRVCDVLRENAGTSSVLGSPVVPNFNDAESVQRRLDLMDLVGTPTSAGESWQQWRAHLERARDDLQNGVTDTKGLVWFPASPAVVRAGADVTAVYAACV